MPPMAAKRKPEAGSWAERLKALRARLGLTQVQAAARIGVVTGTWIAWENNQRTPGRLTQRLLKSEFPDL